MRRHDDRVEPEQRAVGRRLDGEHVERGAAELAVLDRLGERVLVDDAAASGVDQPRAGLHQRAARAPRSAPRSRTCAAGGSRRSRPAPAGPRASASRRRPSPWPGPARRTGRTRSRACRTRRRAARPARRRVRDRRGRASCRRAPRPPTADRSHEPAFSAACACGMFRACASSSAIVCSAAVMTLDCGALTTITPRRVAASTSTLSRPIPARATTFRFVAAVEHLGGDLRGAADDQRVVRTRSRRRGRRWRARGARRPGSPRGAARAPASRASR